MATKYANAIGGSVTGVPSSMVVTPSDTVSMFGMASNGATSVPAAGATIVIQKASVVGGPYSNVSTVTADGTGAYLGSGGTISATTFFRAAWVVRGDPGALIYTSTPVQVTIGGAGIVPMRIAGINRYQTAIKVSQSQFATGTIENIVIATGQNFPDALSAAGLSGAAGSPVLLVPAYTTGGTNPASINAVIDEINRIKTGTPVLWVVGGTGSTAAPVIPNAVVAAIQAGTGITGGDTHRLAGANRYGTSQAVADEVHTMMGGAFADKAFVVDGTTFQDALTVGPVSYKQKWPVILTQPTALNSFTSAAITGNGIDTVYVVGSTGNVSNSVVTSLNGLTGVTATRIVGASDLYVRSADFATWALTNAPGTSAGFVGIVTGEDFPDGLSAWAAIGKNGGVMLLTEKMTLSISAATFLTDHKSTITEVIINGGSGAVTATSSRRSTTSSTSRSQDLERSSARTPRCCRRRGAGPKGPAPSFSTAWSRKGRPLEAGPARIKLVPPAGFEPATDMV